MKTQQEIWEFYVNRLLPDLSVLEQKRKNMLKTVRYRNLSEFAGGVVVTVLTILFRDYIPNRGILIPLVLIFSC